MTFRFHGGIFLADTARVLGQVRLGEQTSVWYGAVVRGDVAPITIGRACNVQDNVVIHCDSGKPNVIGDLVTIGHNAVVHGVCVGDGSLVGIGAVLLGGVSVGRDCLIAAGAVLSPGMEVPDGMVVMGVPGKIVRPVNEKEREYLEWLAPHYVKLARLHVEQPDDPRVAAFGAKPQAAMP